MYRHEYMNSVNMMLDDNRQINKDPINVFQNESNNLIDNLYNNSQSINKTYAKQLKRHNRIAPRLYCLCKIHKKDTVSFRFTVSCIKASSYNLAKFLHKTLIDITSTFHFNIRNLFELVHIINNRSTDKLHFSLL